MKKLIKDYILDIEEEIISIRRHFHMYPETAFNEFETSKRIADFLRQWGLEVTEGVAKTGVVGLLKGENPGKTIAIRADIDALPLTEKTGLEYSSKNIGNMHACGHDGHIAIALGTAKVLSKLKDKINGNVKFIFQPAEEGPGGAEIMIKEGVLENPKVDAIIGLHIWADAPLGDVQISYGPIMASADRFDIKVIGKGGHGAIPHLSLDPIVVGAHIVTSLQTIISREIDPLDSAVISNCTFKSGDAFNIIPNEASITGTVRTFSKELRDFIPMRMREIVENITKAMRCTYEFDYYYWYPATINHVEFTKMFKNIAEDVLGKNKVYERMRPSMGSEDFSYYLQKTPGTYFFLGTRDESNGYDKSLHHPKYSINEQVLSIGVELFCNTVLKYLNK